MSGHLLDRPKGARLRGGAACERLPEDERRSRRLGRRKAALGRSYPACEPRMDFAESPRSSIPLKEDGAVGPGCFRKEWGGGGICILPHGRQEFGGPLRAQEMREGKIGRAGFTPEDAGIEPHYTSPPKDVNAFADFCGQMVRRYC